MTLLLVGGDRGQMIPEIALGSDGLVEPVFGMGQSDSGGGDGGMVPPAPPSPGRLVQMFLAVGD